MGDVRFILFCVALGGGYGIAHEVFGFSQGWAAAAGWAAALLGWLLWRWRGRAYRAGFQVAQYRAAAEELRVTDPETYSQILSHAEEGEPEEVARRDPDAFVALFLASAADLGYETPEEAPDPNSALRHNQETHRDSGS